MGRYDPKRSGPEVNLRPAKGALYGVVLGLAVWLLIAVVMLGSLH